jgi:pyrimidine-nucleoside phosphorylase
MSKKIACSSDVILLDVKVGSGAFAKDVDQAKELAETMIAIGQGLGRTVGAVITDMSQPLGNTVGNALEVKEAIATLHNQGPADFTELCIQLSSNLLQMCGVSLADARTSIEAALSSGAARAKLAEIITAQGGDARVCEDTSLLPQAAHVYEVKAQHSGAISKIDTAGVGMAASVLGAGRERKEDTIDPAVGIVIEKKLGDRVQVGDVLATLHANDPSRSAEAEALLQKSYIIGSIAQMGPLIYEVIRPPYKK